MTRLLESPSSARIAAYTGTRPAVQALVPLTASRILDLGCATGALGGALKQRQDAVVVGIERDPSFVSQARHRLDEVVEADLNTYLVGGSLVEDLGRFDCVIAADVLEHLLDPWTALARATSLLDTDGVAVVSLPNVQNWRTLHAIAVKKRWPLEAAGLFDRTHLRWFTRRDAEDLLAGSGLTLELVHRRWSHDDSRLKQFLDTTPLRDFLAIQFLLRARRHA